MNSDINLDQPAAKGAPAGDTEARFLARASWNAYSPRRYFAAAVAVSVVIVAVAWVWAVNGRMAFLDPEYPMWSAKLQMVEECRHGDTIILGASSAMAGLAPEVLGDKVSNLALGGGGPIESYYIMTRVLACPSPPRRVLFSFLPVNLVRVQSYWERTALFSFLTFEQMEEVRRASVRVSDSSIYVTSRFATVLDVIKNYSYEISLPSYYFAAMMNAGLVGRRARNERELEATLASRGQHFFGMAARADGLSEDAQLSAFTPSPLLRDYFIRLLALLRDRNIEAYFVSAPVNPATYEHLAPSVRDGFAAYLEQLRVVHPNFHILGDVVPVMPADNFGDPEHLNPAGAEAWSSRVKTYLSNVAPQR